MLNCWSITWPVGFERLRLHAYRPVHHHLPITRQNSWQYLVTTTSSTNAHTVYYYYYYYYYSLSLHGTGYESNGWCLNLVIQGIFYRSSGVWHRVASLALPDVSKECSAFIFSQPRWLARHSPIAFQTRNNVSLSHVQHSSWTSQTFKMTAIGTFGTSKKKTNPAR